jgi:hypothetical protein
MALKLVGFNQKVKAVLEDEVIPDIVRELNKCRLTWEKVEGEDKIDKIEIHAVICLQYDVIERIPKLLVELTHKLAELAPKDDPWPKCTGIRTHQKTTFGVKTTLIFAPPS